MRRRRLREPSRRRYGVIYRPSGRPGMTVMDWVNDGGKDEPLSPADSRVLILMLLALILGGATLGALLYVVL